MERLSPSVHLIETPLLHDLPTVAPVTLPAVLSDHLPDYAPGRITLVTPEAWPLHDVDRPDEGGAPGTRLGIGIRTTIPRYALELRTARAGVYPDRVRWLVERSATRPLSARHVHLVHHRGLLHVVDGHHALAAHLAVGSDRIPVRLLRPV